MMTPKKEIFIKEYLVDLNATQAAVRAGFSFSIHAVGYYVYFLIDPRDESIFYVGKGKGKRVSSHVKSVAAGNFINAPKAKLIRDILSAGLTVREVIFVAGLTEPEAYSLEREFICAFKGHGLTNIASGCMTNDELVELQASDLLANLKPFGRWVAGMSERQRHNAEVLAESLGGDLWQFYRWYQSSLLTLAGI